VLSELMGRRPKRAAILGSCLTQHIRGPRRQSRRLLSGQNKRGGTASDADSGAEHDYRCMFGAIFYRLLVRSSPLTEEFSDKLVRQVFAVPDVERANSEAYHTFKPRGSNRRDLQ